MKRNAIVALILFTAVVARAQDSNGSYNPYVSDGSVTPVPLMPLEDAGEGLISFGLGNSGDDPLAVYSGHFIILTVTLSNMVPAQEDPLVSMGGSSAGLFAWSYDPETLTYTGKQNLEMPAQSEGVVEIAVKVNRNSTEPGSNGFNVNITPAPYQVASNTQDDDATHAYTYTENTSLVPGWKGSSIHLYPNPADETVFLSPLPDLKDGVIAVYASDGRLVKSLDFNGNGNRIRIDMKGSPSGVYHLVISGDKQTFQGEFVLK